MRTRAWSWIAVIAGLLYACGGGGGGGQDDHGGGSGATQPLTLVVTSAPNSNLLTNVTPFPVFGSTSAGAAVTVNGAAATVDAAGRFSTSVALAAGANPVSVVASLAGAQSTVQFTVTLQQALPSLTVTQPPGAIVTKIASQAVAGTTAASGVRVFVNDVEQTLTAGAFATNVTLQPGANPIRVVARDEAGNETLVQRSAVLDTSGPMLIVSNLSDGATVYREPLLFLGFVEPGATVTVSGSAAFLQPDPNGPTAWSFSPAGFEAVTNAAIVASDPAGNTTTLNMTINRFAPPGTVYVARESPAATDAATCGNVTAPCATINVGIGRAVTRGASRVLVATGVYPESVNLIPGRNLLGGFDTDFGTRNLTTLRAEILGTGTKSVVALGITAGTLLEGFIVRGPLAVAAGANSTAIYIRDSTSALSIKNNLIFGGRATNGAAAGSTLPSQVGADGQNGASALALTGACAPANLRANPAGGLRNVGIDDISGGAGGGNKACPNGTLSEISGQDGTTGQPGSPGGAAGAGSDAGDDMSLTGTTCSLPAAPFEGAAGIAGSGGGNGSSGGGGTAVNIVSHEWVASPGGSGSAGQNGGGGGGGGAGGSARCVSGCAGDILGATGGGGGSGGAAGIGGGSGGGGGGAFGVFLSFQTTPASLPVITGNVIHNGLGGNGGSGGSGGTGTAGGKGGQAGTGLACGGASGKGGDGGAGGHGGGGGGGRGGDSVGVFANLAGFAGTPTYGTDNSIVTTSGSAGLAGPGGLSLGNTGGNGAAGAVSATTNLP